MLTVPVGADHTEASSDEDADTDDATSDDEGPGDGPPDGDDQEDQPAASPGAMAAAVAAASCGWARVTRVPRHRSRHVVLDLCSPEGVLEQRTVAASHDRRLGRGAYGMAKSLRWGDAWPFPQPRTDR